MCYRCDQGRNVPSLLPLVVELRQCEQGERLALDIASAKPKFGSMVLSQWTNPLTGTRVSTDPQVKCSWKRDPNDDPRVVEWHRRVVKLRSILRSKMGERV